MVREFNRIEDIEKYYNKERNTYIFKENNKYIDLVIFNFKLDIKANIEAENIEAMHIDARNITANDIDVGNLKAWDITAKNILVCNLKACNINAVDINAVDIDALDIEANDINTLTIKANNIKANDIRYYAFCFAYYEIKCKSIKGSKAKSKHFVLDGKIEVNA